MATLDDLSLDQLQALYAQKTDPHVAAIHSIESGGASASANPVNPASGASGSMQTMAATARDPGYGVKPSDGTPVDKTRLGVEYYQKLRDKYQDPVKAAVAYDWGPGNADKWIANGAKLDDLPLETLQYVQKFQKKTAGAQAPQQAQQPAEKPLPQPTTTEMNIVEQPAADTPDYTFGGRLAQGAMNTIGGAARAGLHGLGWLLDKAGDKQGAANLNDTVQQAEEAQAARTREFELKRQQAGGGTGTDWVQVGGQMIPAFLVPGGGAKSLLGAMGEGAAGGAVLGAADTPPGESYGQHAATGALTGGAVSGALGAVGKIIGGANLSPHAQLLKDEGVTLTPGMVGGKIANDIEQKMSSWPIVGPLVADSRRQAVHEMNDAALQRALTPIGEDLPKGMPVQEAIDYTKTKLSDAYKQILPNLNFAPDAAYTADMQAVLAKQAQLPDALRTSFDQTMNDLIAKATVPGPNGTQVLTGDALKKAESVLGQKAKNFMSSGDAFQRDLGNVYRDALTAFRAGVVRQNPQYGPQLQAINNGFSVLAIMRQAGNNLKNPENPIMPGALSSAVRSKSGGVDKDQFARGVANMQDMSGAANAVLGATVPDSGSIGRLMMGTGLLGGIGIPALMGSPVTAATAAGIAAGYGTDAGRKALFALLARRPDLMRELGQGIQSQAGNFGMLAGAIPSGSQ